MIVSVKHNFETAHRLPFLEGKCQNIHGHSWWVEWLFEQPMDKDGLTLEYGSLKKKLRDWVDTHLDHGIMLGKDDRLLTAIKLDQCKVFTFGEDYFMPWPTVEAVASMLAEKALQLTEVTPYEVRVQETHVNSAIWQMEY